MAFLIPDKSIPAVVSDAGMGETYPRRETYALGSGLTSLLNVHRFFRRVALPSVTIRPRLAHSGHGGDYNTATKGSLRGCRRKRGFERCFVFRFASVSSEIA